MSNSQREAVITFLRKERQRSYVNRPISLVKVDAKIISKVTATRIKDVLPSIIHHNQTGYVKARYLILVKRLDRFLILWI